MVCLTQEQIQFYKQNGYIKISGIFTEEELKELLDEYERVFYVKNNPGLEAAWAGDAMKEAGGNQANSVHSIHNLQFHSAVFLKLLTNDSLLEALEDVMGTPNILLHHTKAHWKPAKIGAPFLIHQDYHYFPYKNDSMVAAFIHLDKSDIESGGLCVYPGTHKLGPQEDLGAEETANRYHYCDPKKFPLEKATPVNAEFGDVVIFSYLLLHGSYKNLSERPRRMFLIQLMSAEDVALEEKHKSPGQGLVLRGRNDNRRAVLAERFLH